MRRHKKISRLLSMLIIACILPGCASLSEGECKTADWFLIGQQDGSNGLERSRLYAHSKACAEYGIRPHSENYYAGREAGLKHYCSPRNGFTVGRAGKTYNNVCPVTTELEFLAEYRQGKVAHDIDKEIQNVESAIDRSEKQLDDDDITTQQVKTLHESLRRDYDKLRYLNRELIRVERRHESRRMH